MNKNQLLTLIKGIIPDTVAKTLTIDQLKEIAINRDLIVDQSEFKELVFAPNEIDGNNKTLMGETANYIIIAVSKNNSKRKISNDAKTGKVFFKGIEYINTASRFGKLGAYNAYQYKIMIRKAD